MNMEVIRAYSYLASACQQCSRMKKKKVILMERDLRLLLLKGILKFLKNVIRYLHLQQKSIPMSWRTLMVNLRWKTWLLLGKVK